MKRFLPIALALALVMSCGTEEPEPLEEPLPDPVDEARALVEARLEILDEYLAQVAFDVAVDEAMETLVEAEASRPFLARVESGLRYSTVYQREIVGGPLRTAFVDEQGLTPIGEATVEVLRDAWRHGLDPEPMQLDIIEELLTRLNGTNGGELPSLDPTPEEVEALVGALQPAIADGEVTDVDAAMGALLIAAAREPEQEEALSRWGEVVAEAAEAWGPRAARVAELELYIADGALRYARKMRHANLNRKDWRALRDAGGSTEVILSRMQKTLRDLHHAESPVEVYGVFRDLEPSHVQYRGLLQAAEKYRQIVDDGGWERVPTFRLEEGARPERVVALRERLAREGYDSMPDLEAAREAHDAQEAARIEILRQEALAEWAAELAEAEELVDDEEVVEVPDVEEPSDEELGLPEPTPFDEEAALGTVDDLLIEAVRHYQRTHQFPDTGEPTPGFWRSLNISAEQRLDQIMLNLQRWRDSHYEDDETYILVNIPDFHVEVYEAGELAMRFSAIVGRNNRVCDRESRQWDYPNSTPTLMSKMDHLIFNPSWYLPARLVRENIEPRRREDPGFFEREGYQEVRMADGRTVVRQNPGPDNALGRVKFMFPNEHNVYLHDTPQRQYFDRTLRTFSAGCVRISQPLELAQHLLDREGRDDLNIDEILESGRTRLVNLEEPIPVMIEYYSVWVDDDGFPVFLADPYRKDARDLSEEPEEYFNCTPRRAAPAEPPPSDEEAEPDAEVVPLPLNIDLGP